MASSDIDQQLKELEEKYGFTRPDRGDLDAPVYQSRWREGKPDYRIADLLFYEGKTKNHPPGSFEMVLENLVKKWEMELSHITAIEGWSTVDSKDYRVQTNGGPEINAQDSAKMGSYNWLMEDVSKDLYDSENETFASSHKAFRGAFTKGFAWEVLEVFSGPPKVAFSWRHWGKFTGEYKGVKGAGQTIELYGFSIAILNSQGKIVKVEAYSKFEGFLRALLGKTVPEDLIRGHELVGTGCPLHKSQ